MARNAVTETAKSPILPPIAEITEAGGVSQPEFKAQEPGEPVV